MSSEVVAGVCACAVIILAKEMRTKKFKKKRWRRQLFSRHEGHAKNLLNDLKLEDGQGFRNFLRMTLILNYYLT